MLKYLIIIIDDTSTSYCHCDISRYESRLISIDDLKKGILFAMKENLSVQYILPDYELPDSYIEIMDTIDAYSYVSSTCEDSRFVQDANVIVFNDWMSLDMFKYSDDKVYVLRTTKDEFFERYNFLKYPLSVVTRLNVVFTDIETFTVPDYERYKQILSSLSFFIEQEYTKKHSLQFNLLTDRLMLTSMNNCNAGYENVTLAPDGNFYICPAYYYENSKSIGNINSGLDIKNPNLFQLDYSPICRHCDAFQCKRCVWLNNKMTWDVNTPSHEQCVMAHIERNIARELLQRLNNLGLYFPVSKLEKIDYLDPFEEREKW